MIAFINNLKTALFLGLLMGLCLVVGYLIGGREALIIAFLIGAGLNFFAYFYSDKIALVTMRAQQVGPDDAPQLVALVRRLAERAGLPMPRVYIIPTDAPNAFATGRNPKNAAVAVTEGLLRILNQNELAGVIGHELAHVRNRDILISSVAATIAGAISMLGYMLYFVPLGGSSSRREGNPLVALVIIILAPIAAALIQMAISRSREYNADEAGANLSGNPMCLATALERLDAHSRRIPLPVSPAQANMFIVEPLTGKSLAGLFSTHPPLEKRLRALIGRDSTGWIG